MLKSRLPFKMTKRPLPVELPAADRARYQLVVVTRGSRETSLKGFPGSSGTLQINTGIEGHTHDKTPLTYYGGHYSFDRHGPVTLQSGFLCSPSRFRAHRLWQNR